MDSDLLLGATGITKHFGSMQVLHGVDLQVRRGEALGVVGPNGAGKTTLFGVLAGTLPASGFSTRGVTSAPGTRRIAAAPALAAPTRCRAPSSA
jgi:ABC-type branched-subunit amino acid transport system ATPase component